MSRYVALRYLSSSEWCPHSPEVIVSLLCHFQSALNNVGTVCKAHRDSAGGLCGVEEAKPDAGPEGNPRTTSSLEVTSRFGAKGRP